MKYQYIISFSLTLLIAFSGCVDYQNSEKQISATGSTYITIQPTFTPLEMVASVTTKPTTLIRSGNSKICNCSGNLYNCPDFSSYAEAQACYDYCNQKDKGIFTNLTQIKMEMPVKQNNAEESLIKTTLISI